MPRKPATNIDPFAVFKQATAFELATHVLTLQHKENPSLRVPLVVASAFSLELHLKCLLHIQGSPEKAEGHKLRLLYDRLSPTNRSAVRVYFEERKLVNPVMQNIFRHERAGNLPTLAWDIESTLDRINNAFPQWRYIFELAVNDEVYAGSQPIRDAVRAVILDQRPTWPWQIA